MKFTAQDILNLDIQTFIKNCQDGGEEFRDEFLRAYLKWSVSFQVKALRHKKGWTQGELAQRAGLHVVTVWRIEQGHRLDFSIKSLKKIAVAFDCALLIRFDSWSNLVKELYSYQEVNEAAEPLKELERKLAPASWDETAHELRAALMEDDSS